jgi:DNA helicase HerA-like ATPase
VNTRNLTDVEERAVISILTSKLLEERKALLDKDPEKLFQKPAILIVLEEALSVLSERVLRRGSNIFVELVREGRKYKVGLLCVVQIPHRLDPDVAGNINTNVILGLAQNRGRRAVADNSMDDMDPLIDEMKMLDIGEAIISYPHKGEVPFPLPVKIYHFNELVKQHRARRVSEPKPELDEAFME